MPQLTMLTKFGDMPDGLVITTTDEILNAIAANVAPNSSLTGGSDGSTAIHDLHDIAKRETTYTFPAVYNGSDFAYAIVPVYEAHLTKSSYFMVLKGQRVHFVNDTDRTIKVYLMTRNAGKTYIDDIIQIKPFMSKTR